MKALLFLFLISSGNFSKLPANESMLHSYVRSSAHEVKNTACLTPLIERISDAEYVLLGEASHGTSEYYIWRKRISKRLIEEKGFSFIAVEGDWSAAYRVNKYVKDLPGAPDNAREALTGFNRWPQWMWSNTETLALVEWLRVWNMKLPMEKRVGFYGIDLYGFKESLPEVISFFEKFNPENLGLVKDAYSCLMPWLENMHDYARNVMSSRKNCVQETESVVMLTESPQKETDPTEAFNARQNAHVVRNAERHFRSMAARGPESWNSRVDHFFRTVERLKEHYGENSRAIVWAHNTHVGDARATSMVTHGQENIGKLLRETHGEKNVFILGFGTYRGNVLAGTNWGSPGQIMRVPDAVSGSIENLFHEAQIDQSLFFFDDKTPAPLFEQRGHRAKGVVYNPSQETGNYVPTVLPRRYDAFFYIKETKALNPLE